jgi:hypothetical protein
MRKSDVKNGEKIIKLLFSCVYMLRRKNVGRNYDKITIIAVAVVVVVV